MSPKKVNPVVQEHPTMQPCKDCGEWYIIPFIGQVRCRKCQEIYLKKFAAKVSKINSEV